MKHVLFFIIAIAGLFSPVAQAQSADSLWVQRSVQQLQKDNQRLTQTVNRLSRQIDYLSRRVQAVEKSAADSLAGVGEKVNAVQAELAGSTSTLDSRLTTIDQKVDTASATTTRRSHTALLWAIIGTIAVAIALIITYLALRKRISHGSDTIDRMADDAQKLRETQLELDTKLASLLEQQLAISEKVNASSNSAPDHSLIISIANEMARIEQNLQFMDPKTKGVSQLRNRAKAITEALKKKGYEVPALIGTEYKEGYNMEATVEEDETIELGKMIIRRVTRPAVLFNGKMIQAAQVVVAFNPDN